MIDSRMATVLIFAILASSVTVIAITALVVGYLEKRNSNGLGRQLEGKALGKPPRTNMSTHTMPDPQERPTRSG